MIYKVIFKKFLNKIGHYLISTSNSIFTYEEMVRSKFKKDKSFYFLQIGAHDGVSHDFMSEFLKERNSMGVLVEPINEYFLALQENFKMLPNFKLVNRALHSHNKEAKIYKVKGEEINNLPNWAAASASFSKENLLKFDISENQIEYENVICSTFMEIYNEFYEFKKIDVLQIDVEGYDFEVLKMIDFDIIKPKIIRYEHMNLTESDYLKSINILKGYGYILFQEGIDTIGIKK
jgi:FkbM family methyltransferase